MSTETDRKHHARRLRDDAIPIGLSVCGPLIGEVVLMLFYLGDPRAGAVTWIFIPVLLIAGFTPLAKRFPRDWYPIALVYFPLVFFAMMYLASPIAWYIFGKRL
jgi:hypothetical protein